MMYVRVKIHWYPDHSENGFQESSAKIRKSYCDIRDGEKNILTEIFIR